jgi:predicted heme/steroid binding protein
MISRISINKKVIALLILALMMMLVSACAPQEEPASPEEEPGVPEAEEPMLPDDELPVFTIEELSEYDGQDGRPAYVAVDGIVYDVTDNEMWEGGTHPGGHQASEELTTELHENSPHGDSVLEALEAVGRLE